MLDIVCIKYKATRHFEPIRCNMQLTKTQMVHDKIHTTTICTNVLQSADLFWYES